MPECIQFLFSRKCPAPIMEKGTGQTLVNRVFVCLSYNIFHCFPFNIIMVRVNKNNLHILKSLIQFIQDLAELSKLRFGHLTFTFFNFCLKILCLFQ